MLYRIGTEKEITKADVEEIGAVIDFIEHPCEWAVLISGYVSALYLLNDDYSVVVFIPEAVVPKVLMEDVEVL